MRVLTDLPRESRWHSYLGIVREIQGVKRFAPASLSSLLKQFRRINSSCSYSRERSDFLLLIQERKRKAATMRSFVAKAVQLKTGMCM